MLCCKAVTTPTVTPSVSASPVPSCVN